PRPTSSAGACARATSRWRGSWSSTPTAAASPSPSAPTCPSSRSPTASCAARPRRGRARRRPRPRRRRRRPTSRTGAGRRGAPTTAGANPGRGPAGRGRGAGPQCYEAPGLTPPPRVEISTLTVSLAGAVGERLESVLQVATPEKRPVYAHAASDQPWLRVGRANLQGRVATIPVVVPAVPDRPG